MTPRATYRLQFHKDFGFDDAAALGSYLARLGISHVYASPVFKARPGSTHGYDIVDHNAFNPELGGEAGFRRMGAAFDAEGLKLILDFVPNHVGVGGSGNPAWLSVLEWGPSSPFAGWFDIDWAPDREDLKGRLLVPFLGDHYGAVLQAGQLSVRFDLDEGGLAVWAYDTHKLPVCPLHYARLLGDAAPELERLGDDFSTLPEWRPQVGRRALALKAQLADALKRRPDLLAAVQARLDALNAQTAEGWAELDSLIKDQHWRLAHFRVAADDINYRRFFNISELAGVRVELPEVFDDMHRLVLGLLQERRIDGLRIDHIDGLLDPKAYLQRLRARGGEDFYLVVEKILAPHEELRPDWPVDGTTGYDFVNLVLGLLADPAGEAGLTGAWRDFTGRAPDFSAMVRACKLRVIDNDMFGELDAVARAAAGVAAQTPGSADFTRNILRRALRAVTASLPVYRTYLDEANAPAPEDRRDLDWALAEGRRLEPELDPSVFDFLHRLLSGALVAAPRSGFSRHAALHMAMKLQQYTGPVMAKGMEDTAFYRYGRLIGLNEVGGRPDPIGVSPSAFHRANARRAERWPHAMLAGSTHDTKRGEDARARLVVLSELPEEWGRRVQAWSRLLRARRGDVERQGPPDRNDEYMFYQTLVGAWPPDLLDQAALDPAAMAAFAERVKGALVKSMREAKLRTNWAAPDETYEAAMLAFAAQALDPDQGSAFLGDFLPFAHRIARLGAHNTLVQTVLRLTPPGVPDIYQGSEFWDLSLVDPDNRRPVDYPARAAALDSVKHADFTELMRSWPDGRFKLAAIQRILAFRRQAPALFEDGGYQPLIVEGPDADEVIAFARTAGDVAMVVAAARFPARREAAGAAIEARVNLPGALVACEWRDVLTGGAFAPAEALDAAAILALAPAAALMGAGPGRDAHDLGFGPDSAGDQSRAI